MVSGKPAVIFSKSIKTLFYNFGANPTVYGLDKISEGKEIKQALAEMRCNPTVPVVFIGGEFVGGTNEVMSLHLKSSLVP